MVRLSGIAAIAAGGRHTCALLDDGTVSCFGSNIFGAVGNGMPTDFETTPTPVSGLAGALAIASTGPSFDDLGQDDEYSCALLPGGAASCWGQDTDGALGDGGSALHVASPVSVTGLTGATQLALGGGHACALLSDGSATCRGADLVMSSPTATAVPGLTGAVALAAGSNHTCALLADGTVSCWGANELGQRGSGASSFDETTTPAAVPGLAGVTMLAASGDHTCALLSAGSVQCWGDNVHGQLGDGLSEETHAAPVAVVGITAAVAVSAGIDFSCAVLGDGTARCWGNDDQGQLGNGGPPPESTDPIDVLTPVEVIAGAGADGGSG